MDGLWSSSSRVHGEAVRPESSRVRLQIRVLSRRFRRICRHRFPSATQRGTRRLAPLHDNAVGVAVDSHGGVGGLSVLGGGRHFVWWGEAEKRSKNVLEVKFVGLQDVIVG